MLRQLFSTAAALALLLEGGSAPTQERPKPPPLIASARREFIKANRARVKAFLAAYREAIRLGKSNKMAALASFRKYMREGDPRRLEVLYKNYVDELLPVKPYPMEEAIQAEIEDLTPTIPEMRGKKPADFIDKSLLAELDEEGFFARLYNK